MRKKKSSGLMDAIRQINPDADLQLLYDIHVKNRKVFLHLQMLYAVFFICIFAIYILLVGVDYSVHSGFAITVCMSASALFSIEAYRNWMISDQFSLDDDST